jgi:GTP-binding protein
MASFIDQVTINVTGGTGGSGSKSMHRAKYVPLGGPDGGDGGHAGSVILEADASVRTLIDFTWLDHYVAPDGIKGGKNNCFGAKGEDKVLKVPLGTVVRDSATGEQLGDLVEQGQRMVVAQGGRGGRGNVHFKTSTHQAPELYEKGEPGEERRLRLELKLLADVGLVGFPNAGKSTLLSVVTAARPKIANYPFTTLEPQLGVVRLGEQESFVLADLPGLVEGAAEGHGLGHRFLKHLERTRLLLFILDAAGTDGRDPLADFEILRAELKRYHAGMAALPMVVAANKLDLEEGRAGFKLLEKAFKRKKIPLFGISAAAKQGTPELMRAVYEKMKASPSVTLQEKAASVDRKVYKPEPRFTISRDKDGGYVVEGREVRKWVSMTDFDNAEAAAKLKRVLTKMGLEKALKEAGVAEGDSVRVGKDEFFYEP